MIELVDDLFVILTVGLISGIVSKRLGLPWHAAAGMGLGLAQLGELSFVLLSEGQHANLISNLDYNRMLFVAMGTLLLTPQLLKCGLRWTRRWPQVDDSVEERRGALPPAPEEAIVIGLGPMGRQAVSQLETMGIDVCLLDLSPVNLHAYAQQGFRTVSGDGGDPEVLNRADAAHARLAVVCVPDDRIALQIVKTLCRLNPRCAVVVRCRYQSNTSALKKAGAQSVVSEEVEASGALLRLLERMNSDSVVG